MRQAVLARNALQAISWWVAAVGTLVAMAAWIGVGTGGMAAFDHRGLTLANAWRSPWLDAIFLNLTWLGSLAVLLPLVLAVGVALWRRGFRGEAGFLVAASAGAAIFAQLAKHLALRPRPDLFGALDSVASPLSFPSAHAMQVTAVGLAFMVIAVRFAPRRWRWAVPGLVLVVALVGFSRLYLQVHYPSDVVAGILAGAYWVLGLRALAYMADSIPDGPGGRDR